MTSNEAYTPRTRGTGLVVAGAIFLVIGLLVTVGALAFFINGMSTPDGDQAMSMIFPFLIMAWMVFGAAPWYLGLILSALGRRQQRGPVTGEVVWWIFGCAVYPAVFFQLGLLVAGIGTVPTFIIFAFSIPVFILLSWLGAAMLIWGKARPHQQAAITTV